MRSVSAQQTSDPVIKYQVGSGTTSLRGRRSQSAAAGPTGGREGREGGEEKEPQPRPAPASSAGHAQQQLGTLINLSEGSDLFVCEGPG